MGLKIMTKTARGNDTERKEPIRLYQENRTFSSESVIIKLKSCQLMLKQKLTDKKN